jgi:hypothetical protein
MLVMCLADTSAIARSLLNTIALSHATDLEEIFNANNRKKLTSVSHVEGLLALSDSVEDIDSPLVHVVLDSDDELLHGVETGLLQVLDGSLADGLEEPNSRKAQDCLPLVRSELFG